MLSIFQLFSSHFHTTVSQTINDTASYGLGRQEKYASKLNF